MQRGDREMGGGGWVSGEDITKSVAIHFASHFVLFFYLNQLTHFLHYLSLFSDYNERVVANKLSYKVNQ